jgi:hypothetical protein
MKLRVALLSTVAIAGVSTLLLGQAPTSEPTISASQLSITANDGSTLLLAQAPGIPPADDRAGGGTASAPQEQTTASGLKYTITQPSDGGAKAGDTVWVHYTGKLTNGTKFDSSLDRNEPFSFPLGGGQVIKGWDEGVVGMKVGEKRTLVIPPNLGYGAAGAGGDIPPNATLVFDVELLGITRNVPMGRGR